jgi:hypothetical protein
MRAAWLVAAVVACHGVPDPAPPPTAQRTVHVELPDNAVVTAFAGDGSGGFAITDRGRLAIAWATGSATSSGDVAAAPPPCPAASDETTTAYVSDGALVLQVGTAGDRGYALARDAATCAVRWRRELRAIARDVATHGDELAVVYDPPDNAIDVLALADGAPRRTAHLDRELAGPTYDFGFDGDVAWFYRYVPAHDNPSDHMLGTAPRAPSPPHCEYLAYDTRVDRRAPIRTNDTSAARELFMTCLAIAVVGTPTGVIVVAQPRPGALEATWFDRAP